MKTNEFIKDVEAMGFEVKISFGWLGIYDDGLFVSKVSENHIFSVDTNVIFFDRLEETKKQQIFKLLTEYASTPIEEREEEKKYRYYLKSVKGLDYVKCWNFNEISNEWFLGGEHETLNTKTAFTHSELIERCVDVEDLRKKYKEVEVTE